MKQIMMGLAMLGILGLAACSEDVLLDALNGDSVNVSGSITWTGWEGGDIYVVAFPQGTPPGPTGMVGQTMVPGAPSASYSVMVPESSNVYLFGWSDADADTAPTAGEGGACSGIVVVDLLPVTGVNLTFTADGYCAVSP